MLHGQGKMIDFLRTVGNVISRKFLVKVFQ